MMMTTTTATRTFYYFVHIYYTHNIMYCSLARAETRRLLPLVPRVLPSRLLQAYGYARRRSKRTRICAIILLLLLLCVLRSTYIQYVIYYAVVIRASVDRICGLLKLVRSDRCAVEYT